MKFNDQIVFDNTAEVIASRRKVNANLSFIEATLPILPPVQVEGREPVEGDEVFGYNGQTGIATDVDSATNSIAVNDKWCRLN